MKTDPRDQTQNEVPPTKRIRMSEPETQPPMKSFKAFLYSQDDNISDEEATSKYAEYKMEFRRQQLREFFTAHKEEDWFRLKYHPSESVKRKEELKAAVHKRAFAFMDLFKSGCFEGVSLESEQGEVIEKLLDSFVVRLESDMNDPSVILKDEMKDGIEDNSISRKLSAELSDDNESSDSAKRDYKWIIIDDVGGDDDEDDVNTKHEKVNDALQFSEEVNLDRKPEDKLEITEESVNNNTNTGKNPGESSSRSQFSSIKEDNSEKGNKEGSETLCPLYKTRSVFLKNISPKITKDEIEEACKIYPGFLRVWLSDAQPDQHWCRRGFVTFRRDVNIKQICWNLNSTKIKGCEWQALVNHDLVRRIRTANILAKHKQVIMADLKLATKIIQELDSRAGLWNQNGHKTENLCAETGNPLFSGIMDYLVEEAPAEAEELLGQSAILDEYNTHIADKLKILDKLLFYLRMVHSVDYYNGSLYVHEDEMPNRCGILHTRGPLPPTEVNSNEVDEFIETHAEKLRPLFTPITSLTQASLLALGYKDKEVEMEKFIQANTQELAQDKFLCPLSGKKFKAPEFIRKHILNKYPHELDVIQHDAEYFNNYLLDVKRPELPDHPGILVKKEFEQPYHFPFGGGYRRGFPFGHFGGHGFFLRGRGMPGRGRGGEYRPVVTYRDLDAPNEPDEMV